MIPKSAPDLNPAALGIPTSRAELMQMAVDLAPRMFKAAVVFLIGLLIIKLVVYLFKKVLRTAKVNETLADFLGSIASVVFWFLLVVVILFQLGLGSVATAVSSIVALFSFGIGLGAQGIIADIISGTFLATEKNFRVGARVVAGSKQTEGVIESMDFRKVRVRDDKGRLHVLPNSDVEKNAWVILDGLPAPKK